MAILPLQIPYSNFVLDTIIDPEQFDLNNQIMQDKINELVDAANTVGTGITTAQETIDTHKLDLNNPHQVTATQIGSYLKNEADLLFATKTDISLDLLNVYSKTTSDALYAQKANVYTKSESDNTFASKLETYSKTDIDGKVDMTKGAVASIKGVDSAKGNIDLIGGTGITIAANNDLKTVTITATGEAVPGPHAQEHGTLGADPITPESIGAVSDIDYDTFVTTTNAAISDLQTADTTLQGNIDLIDAKFTSDLAKFKSGTGTFTNRTDNQIFTEAFCTASSLIEVVITSVVDPQGKWTVDSGDGSFTITSELPETADITFNYFITRVV